MSDTTESIRRAMIETMPEALGEAVKAGEPVWDTAELQRDFEVSGFLAPFVVVKRRSDDVVGSLQFVNVVLGADEGPRRVYFGFVPD